MAAGVTMAGWLVAAALLAGVLVQCRARGRSAEALARISHELRGPLTALGLVVAAERRELRPGGGMMTPRGLDAIELELRRTTSVLGDLDTLMSGGRPEEAAPISLEPVAVDSLLAASVRAWAPFADAHGVRLLPPPPTAGPATVLADPGRLAQATGNLIANAVEHGGGAVEVCCRATADTVRVEVGDGGPGLPAPVRDLIRRPRRGGGRRGHGLAIAAAVAAGHGGRLSVAPVQTGARLVLELPRAPG